jgi:hypothetical protein
VGEGNITGGLIGLHVEELQNLYSSPNIIGFISLRRVRRAGHIAHMGR